jgi:hypothetical protein
MTKEGMVICLGDVHDHFDFDKSGRSLGGVGRSDLGGAGGEYGAYSWKKKVSEYVEMKKLGGGG